MPIGTSCGRTLVQVGALTCKYLTYLSRSLWRPLMAAPKYHGFTESLSRQ
jgi:hypothetical protein